MAGPYNTILDTIGHTPVVRIHRLVILGVRGVGRATTRLSLE